MADYGVNDSNKEALLKLEMVDKAIDDFEKTHTGELNEYEHQELRGLLSDRADAMSKVLGVKVHSLFD